MRRRRRQVDEPTGFFGALANAAEWFIGLFQAGGEIFMGLVTGIIPTLIVLLTAVNALIRLIGPERIDKLGECAGRPGLQWYPVRYLVLPVLVGLLPDQPDGLHHGPVPAGEVQAGVLRLGGQLRAPDHRHLPARQRRRAVRLPRHRGRHHHARAQHRRPRRALPARRPRGHPDPRHPHRDHHRPDARRAAPAKTEEVTA